MWSVNFWAAFMPVPIILFAAVFFAAQRLMIGHVRHRHEVEAVRHLMMGWGHETDDRAPLMKKSLDVRLDAKGVVEDEYVPAPMTAAERHLLKTSVFDDIDAAERAVEKDWDAGPGVDITALGPAAHVPVTGPVGITGPTGYVAPLAPPSYDVGHMRPVSKPPPEVIALGSYDPARGRH